MSDTNTDADDEILEYKCRKCPGKTFTAAEKDAHRMFHRTQKEKDKKKPGPKSRTRGARRDASPAPSGVTLFEPINNQSTSNKRTEKEKPAKRTSTRRKAEAQPEPPPDNRKKSKKNYDKSLIGEWQNGNGA